MSSERKGIRIACLLAQATYKPGDQAPDGYLAWHEWAEGPCALCRDAIGCKLRGCCGAANCTVAIPADGKICNCWQYRRGELTAGWACPQHGQQW